MSKRILVPVLALAAFGVTAKASIATYCTGDQSSCTDTAAAFSSATSNLSTVNFDAMVLDGDGGFEDTTTGLMLDDPAFNPANVSESSGVLTDRNHGFNVTLPAGAILFAFDILLPGGSTGASYSIAFNADSNHYTTTLSNNNSGASSFFFGAVSDGEITGLSISGPATVQISNFELQGTGQADTPEVGTLLLIGAGLISMRWMRRAQLRFFGPPQTA